MDAWVYALEAGLPEYRYHYAGAFHGAQTFWGDPTASDLYDVANRVYQRVDDPRPSSTDLARRLSIPARMDFVQVSSYGGGTVPSRTLALAKGIDADIRGMHVLLVDGIIDTGGTLDFLLNHLRKAGPASLKTAVLLDKHSRRTKDVQVDYRGFEIPDRFVVGYGMDFGEKYRSLPYIAVIEHK